MAFIQCPSVFVRFDLGTIGASMPKNAIRPVAQMIYLWSAGLVSASYCADLLRTKVPGHQRAPVHARTRTHDRSNHDRTCACEEVLPLAAHTLTQRARLVAVYARYTRSICAP